MRPVPRTEEVHFYFALLGLSFASPSTFPLFTPFCDYIPLSSPFSIKLNIFFLIFIGSRAQGKLFPRFSSSSKHPFLLPT